MKVPCVYAKYSTRNLHEEKGGRGSRGKKMKWMDGMVHIANNRAVLVDDNNKELDYIMVKGTRIDVDEDMVSVYFPCYTVMCDEPFMEVLKRCGTSAHTTTPSTAPSTTPSIAHNTIHDTNTTSSGTTNTTDSGTVHDTDSGMNSGTGNKKRKSFSELINIL
ncbi:hypothetical protein NEFER03_1569 [Nematocida sp. LUAm3]|nr:hypothetical protein NEFER03_1569 [Nematocida sp. LUAm3]KAI5174602.1 hypothetical protein NEFER02_0723 [Nematocida sp. LUAm2]KAI5177992.1 hypothetical protein NEFER01_1174 [Nematocida sp. LUAm1]